MGKTFVNILTFCLGHLAKIRVTIFLIKILRYLQGTKVSFLNMFPWIPPEIMLMSTLAVHKLG